LHTSISDILVRAMDLDSPRVFAIEAARAWRSRHRPKRASARTDHADFFSSLPDAMLRLRSTTDAAWTTCVLENMNAFLQDHAANERKVASSALTLATQHPTRHHLVEAMIDVAREELEHFAQVYALLVARDMPLATDGPDPYMGRFLSVVRKRDVNEYLLDRLVAFAIIEARGCERFGLVGEALPEGDLKLFYQDLTRSEARHHALYMRLARRYFPAEAVEDRLDLLLDHEAAVLSGLPIRPALH